MTVVKNIGDFLRLLSKVKETKPGEWIARCPAHDDKQPSLSVKLVRDRILLHCHAGCDYESILRALTLEKADLFLGDKSNKKTEIVSSYYYTDAKGVLLFQVCRKKPKGFFQRRADGQGGWINNLKGVSRVLYHLPELVGADPQTPVFVVEGEKDADRLHNEGLLATTNAGGAGKWRADYDQTLKGHPVIIIPDNDKPGQDHAEKVARALKAVARSVKVLQLNDLPKGGDVSDWLDQGHTAKELQPLIEQLPKWIPTPIEQGPQEEKEERLPVSEYLIRIAEDGCYEFFTDTAKDNFVQMPVRHHREVWALADRRFTRWVSNQYHKQHEKAPHTQAISDARLILETKCQQGATYKLYNRVGSRDGFLWYDLCNDSWEAVKVSGDGWEITDRQSPLFYRYKHQLPQVTPQHGGNVGNILRFLNLSHNKDLELLLQVYLVSCFVPDIPHPILVSAGPQGAAKSSLFRILRTVFDPSMTPLLSFSYDQKELVQLLQHNWAAYFDNLTRFPDWVSDSLCRASTGEGVSKRRLYTDDEDVIYAYKRIVGINAISNPARRPDFLDRSIIVNLQRIRDKDRQSEKILREELTRELPGILGGCFDALVHAMKMYPKMDLPELPRMADFAQWGAVIADTWGKKGEFWKAYQTNIAELNTLALESQPFAQAIIALMGKENRLPFEWKGTSKELLEELVPIARTEGIDIESKAWPGNAIWAKRRLEEARANLEQVGIAVHFKTNKGIKYIVLSRGVTKTSKNGPTKVREERLL